MRGTWQGSGTWQTAGGGHGDGLIAVAVVAVLVLEWVAAHVWWILAGTGGAAVLVVTPLWLMARKYRAGAGGHTWTAVATAADDRPAVAAKPATALQRPREVHYHLHGVDAAAAAELLAARRDEGRNP